MVDGPTRAVIADSMRLWRERLATLIGEAAEAHPPRTAIDPVALADELLIVFEGAPVATGARRTEVARRDARAAPAR